MGALSSRLCVSLLNFCIQIQDPEYTGRNNHLQRYTALTTPRTLGGGSFEITGCASESLSALGVEIKMMVRGDEDLVEFGRRSQYTHICLHT